MDEVTVVVDDVVVVIEVVEEVVVVELTNTVRANVVVPYTVGG